MSIVSKALDAKVALFYLLAQLVGCFGASLQLYLNNKWKHGTSAFGKYPGYVGTREWFWGILLEFTATLFFAFFVTAFRNYGRCPQAMVAPLIGLSYIAFSASISGQTGGALDTFFYLAPAFLHNQWSNALVYIVGPPLGAICGYFLFNVLFTKSSGGDSQNDNIRKPLID